MPVSPTSPTETRASAEKRGTSIDSGWSGDPREIASQATVSKPASQMPAAARWMTLAVTGAGEA